MLKKVTRTFVLGALALAVALGGAMVWSTSAKASDPFLAQVKMFGFNFAPRGWALCDGQILPINQNQSLFSLLGTTYGGDGRTNFALPDLRGRFPMHEGNSYTNGSANHTLGQKDGSETNTLTLAQMPSHTHPVLTATVNAYSGNGNTEYPTGTIWAKAPRMRKYSTAAPNVAMDSGIAALGATGSATPVNNMPPFIVVNYAIAIQGLFPSRN
jgi:microcystin-dependent protein